MTTQYLVSKVKITQKPVLSSINIEFRYFGFEQLQQKSLTLIVREDFEVLLLV